MTHHTARPHPHPHSLPLPHRRGSAVFILTAAILTLSGGGQAWGQLFAGLSPDELTRGSKMLATFGPVVEPVVPATVAIEHEGEQVALGLVVDAGGYILTKASELSQAVTCHLADGRKLAARIIGISPDHDLAMLQVEAEDLSTAVWGDASKLHLGDFVATPGPDGPLTVGVVSVKPRRIPPRSGLLGIQMGEPQEQGVPIEQVFESSGAEEAGLRVGDVVTHIDDTPTPSREDLGQAVRSRSAGDSITVRYLRDGQEQQTTARLRAQVPGMGLSRDAMMNRMGGELSVRAHGFPLALQHDAVIAPSDCGGPLVDLDGRVVGINIARAGRTTTYAIPASEVLGLLDELKSGRLAPADEQDVTQAIEEAAEQPQ